MKACKRILTKEDIISRFFKLPNWWGTRYCNIMDYRITRKGKLERFQIWGDQSYWEEVTWRRFNEDLKDYLSLKKSIRDMNDFSKLNWNFLKEV